MLLRKSRLRHRTVGGKRLGEICRRYQIQPRQQYKTRSGLVVEDLGGGMANIAISQSLPRAVANNIATMLREATAD
jgi:hypothetical protein